MRLIPAETTLVVAGDWNQAILTPQWMAEHAFGGHGMAGGAVQVQMAIGQGLFESPKYTIGDLSYLLRPGIFVLSTASVEPGALNVLEAVVDAVLQNLAHTPVRGVGHNFTFQSARPRPEAFVPANASAIDIIDAMPADWIKTSTQLSAVFRREAGGEVLTTIDRNFDDQGIAVKFNFHHPVNTVAQALQVLGGEGGYQRMAETQQVASGLMTTLYGAPTDDEG